MIYISAVIGVWNLPNMYINYTKLHSIENKYYKIYTNSITCYEDMGTAITLAMPRSRGTI